MPQLQRRIDGKDFECVGTPATFRGENQARGYAFGRMLRIRRPTKGPRAWQEYGKDTPCVQPINF